MTPAAHGSGYEALHEQALGEPDEDQRRDDHENAGRGHQSPIDAALGDEVGEADRQRLRVLAGGEGQRDEKVVPGEREGDQGAGADARCDQDPGSKRIQHPDAGEHRE
ncbi:MAG TPA: hypothetical protein VIZ17_08440 [Acetobacteraceae bacterium]